MNWNEGNSSLHIGLLIQVIFLCIVDCLIFIIVFDTLKVRPY